METDRLLLRTMEDITRNNTSERRHDFDRKDSNHSHIIIIILIIIITIQVSSVVVAARLREQPAPTTAYTASLELFCVIYAIQFCLMRFGAAFPSQPWSFGARRSAAGRCQASRGGWFWSAAMSLKSLRFEIGWHCLVCRRFLVQT